jgi:bifunctional DNase/RNase
MYNCFTRYGIVVKQIIIHKLVDGVFYSSLICVRDKIEEIIDARTSDAVALSIRFNTPIFTYENILKKAGFTNDNSDQGEGKNHDQWIKNFIKEQTLSDKDKDLSNITLKDLKALLKKFVKEEDYESAAKVRDELSSRKKDK